MLKIRINTYAEACGLLDLPASETNINKLRLIEKQGFTQKGICYAVWRSQDKLMRERRHPKFWGIVLNEVRRHAFPLNKSGT